LRYILHDKLPLHRLGHTRWTALEDKDIAQEIKLRITEKVKGRYLKASDVINVIESPEVQAVLKQKGVFKPSISECTTRHWLAGLGWWYGKMRNGMYVDGHERDDVVEYCRGFVSRWKEYEHRFQKWDNDGIKLL